MMIAMKKRGEWLKERREELKTLDKRKYSMRAVAERLGISSAGLSHLENTDAMPSLDLAMKLARELDRPVEWVLTGSDNYSYEGIPIIGTTITGPDMGWLENAGRGMTINEYVDIPVTGRRLYGLKVSGDVTLSYNEGEVLIVDLDAELVTGEDVVVVSRNALDSSVKILSSQRGGKVFLDSLSDRNQRLISDLSEIIVMHSVVFVAKSHTVMSRKLN